MLDRAKQDGIRGLFPAEEQNNSQWIDGRYAYQERNGDIHKGVELQTELVYGIAWHGMAWRASLSAFAFVQVIINIQPWERKRVWSSSNSRRSISTFSGFQHLRMCLWISIGLVSHRYCRSNREKEIIIFLYHTLHFMGWLAGDDNSFTVF